MKHANAFPWTDAQVERLRKLWADGFSAGLIALDLGVTRNAVIGKAWRLELSRHETRIRIPQGKSGEWKAVASKRRAPKPLPPEPPPLPVELMIPLERLEPHSCRYPHGDGPFLFCGARRVPNSSYCREHDSLCHNRPIRTSTPWPFRREAA